MSWLITPTQLLVDDQDALTYLTAVETADGQALESGVRLAVNAFVKGCKADGIWPAIKASCILAGARTRLGALTPLAGAAPASFSFVDGDYNRKTGLVGDGSTKYLSSNRAGNADPQNNKHASVYISTVATATSFYFADQSSYGSNLSASTTDAFSRLNSADVGGQTTTAGAPSAGLAGLSRASSSAYILRKSSVNTAITNSSVTPSAFALSIFSRTQTPTAYSNARLAFYSIGESLDLALLDARVTTLVNALSAAIP